MGCAVGDTFYVRALGPCTSPGSSKHRTTSASRCEAALLGLAPAIDARFGREANPNVNLAEIWLRDPRYLNQVLVQARETSFGLHGVTSRPAKVSGSCLTMRRGP